MPPAQGPTYFDPDGDLRLEIGPDNVACIICSRALSRASPVFKKMLHGGFAESKPVHGEWVVKLPDDDQEAMFFLLNIVHGQFDDIPKTLPEEKLFNLTILTDKYDMTKSLRPWAEHWLDDLVKTTITPATKARRIWIAWELGNAQLFKSEIQYLLLNCTTELFAGSDADDTGPMGTFTILEALGILEPLAIARTQMVTALLGTVKQLLDNLMGIGQSTPQTCEVSGGPLSDEFSYCQAVVLASLLRALAAASLYPLPDPDMYDGSVRSLCSRLKNVASRIEVLDLNLPGYPDHWHSDCSPTAELIDQLDSAVDNFWDLVDETHIAHLYIQAKKLRMLSRMLLS